MQTKTSLAHINRLISKYNAESHPYVKIHNLIDLVEASIKTYVSAVITIRSKYEPFSADIKKFILTDFITPSLGKWVEFGRNAVLEIFFPDELTTEQYEAIQQVLHEGEQTKVEKAYVKTTNGYKRQQLPPFKNIINMLKKIVHADNHFYPQHELDIALQYFDFQLKLEKNLIINFRNKIAHGAVYDEQNSIDELKKFEPLIKELLDFELLQNSKIIVSDEQGPISELENEPIPLQQLIPLHKYDELHLLYKDKLISSLFPFMFYRKDLPKGQYNNNVLFLNDLKNTEKKQLLSTLHYSSGEHLNEKINLSELKKVFDITQWRSEFKEQIDVDELYADSLTKHFVGRQELLREMEELFEKPQAVHILYGTPGAGKSAFAAQLYQSLNEQQYYRFIYFNYERDSTVQKFYLKFFRYIEKTFDIPVILESYEQEDIRECIKALLLQVSISLQQQNKKFILIIDALDEATAAELKTFPTFTAEGIHILYTSRKNETVSTNFIQHIKNLMPPQILQGLTCTDLRGMLFTITNKYKVTELEQQQPDFLKQLIEKTSGNALYLRHLCEELSDQTITLHELLKIPPSLTAYFDERLMKQIVQQPEVKQLVLLLAHSKGPLRLIDLQYALQLPSIDDARKIVNKVEYLLHEQNGYYRLYHEAFKDYLKSNESSTITLEEIQYAKHQLVTFCENYESYMHLAEYELPKYPFLYYMAHLIDNSADFQKILKLLQDTRYHEIQVAITKDFQTTLTMFQQAIFSFPAQQALQSKPYLESIYTKRNDYFATKNKQSPTVEQLTTMLNIVSSQKDYQFSWFTISSLYRACESKNEQMAYKILRYLEENHSKIELPLENYIDLKLFLQVCITLQEQFPTLNSKILYQFYNIFELLPTATLLIDAFSNVQPLANVLHQFSEKELTELVHLFNFHHHLADADHAMFYTAMLQHLWRIAGHDETLLTIVEQPTLESLYTLPFLDALALHLKAHGEQQTYALFISNSYSLEVVLENLENEVQLEAIHWDEAFYRLLVQLNDGQSLPLTTWATRLIENHLAQGHEQQALALLQVSAIDDERIYMQFNQNLNDVLHLYTMHNKKDALEHMLKLVAACLKHDELNHRGIDAIAHAINHYDSSAPHKNKFVYELFIHCFDAQKQHYIAKIMEQLSIYDRNQYKLFSKILLGLLAAIQSEDDAELAQFLHHWDTDLGTLFSTYLAYVAHILIKRLYEANLIDETFDAVKIHPEMLHLFSSVSGYLLNPETFMAFVNEKKPFFSPPSMILGIVLPHFMQIHGVKNTIACLEAFSLSDEEIEAIIQILANSTNNQEVISTLFKAYPPTEYNALFVQYAIQQQQVTQLPYLNGYWTIDGISFLLENNYFQTAFECAKRFINQEQQEQEIVKMIRETSKFEYWGFTFPLMLEASQHMHFENVFQINLEKTIKDNYINTLLSKKIHLPEPIMKYGSEIQQLRFYLQHVPRYNQAILAWFKTNQVYSWNFLMEEEHHTLFSIINAEHFQIDRDDLNPPLAMLEATLLKEIDYLLFINYLKRCKNPKKELIQRACKLFKKPISQYNTYELQALYIIQAYLLKLNPDFTKVISFNTILNKQKLQQYKENIAYSVILYYHGLKEEARLSFQPLLPLDELFYYNHLQFLYEEKFDTLTPAELEQTDYGIQDYIYRYTTFDAMDRVKELTHFLIENNRISSYEIAIFNTINLLECSVQKGTFDNVLLNELLDQLRALPPDLDKSLIANYLPSLVQASPQWKIVKKLITALQFDESCYELLLICAPSLRNINELNELLHLLTQVHLTKTEQREIIRKLFETISNFYPEEQQAATLLFKYTCTDEYLFNEWKILQKTLEQFSTTSFPSFF